MNKIFLGLVIGLTVQNTYAATTPESQKGLLQESAEVVQCGVKFYLAMAAGNVMSIPELIQECALEAQDVINVWNVAKDHAIQNKDTHAVDKINHLTKQHHENSKNFIERHPYVTAATTLLIGVAAGYKAPH